MVCPVRERDAPLIFAPGLRPTAMQQFDQRHRGVRQNRYVRKIERKLTSFQQARQTDPLPPRGLPTLTELQERRRAPPCFARHGNPRSPPPVKRCRVESDTQLCAGTVVGSSRLAGGSENGGMPAP